MKSLFFALGGLILAALAVLLWQTSYQRQMLRHLQKCLAWNDRYNLEHPTQRAFTKAVERDRIQRERAQRAKAEGAA